MTQQEALQKVRAHIAQVMSDDDVEFVVLEEKTLATDFGWVFFYDTKEFAETGDELARAVGNAPLIVDAKSGHLESTGTAHPVEVYVDLYRKHGTAHPEQ